MDPLSGAVFAGFGFVMVVAAGLPTVLMIAALLYVALRVRDAKAETPDPDLGLKTAYWLLYSLGILTFHIGLTVLAVHVLQSSGDARPQFPVNVGRLPPQADTWSPASRAGCAITLAGGVVAGAFYLVGTLGTRNREWPTVRRVFTGGRIALIGTVAILAFLALVVILFQKDSPSNGLYETCLGTLIVWLPSLAVHVFLFRWGGTPAYHVPIELPKRRRPRPEPREELPEVEPATEVDEEPPPRRRSDDETEDFRRLDDDEERPRRRRPRDEE